MKLEYIILLLFLLILILVIKKKLYCGKVENFDNHTEKKKSNLYNIFPLYDIEFCGNKKKSNKNNPLFIATFLPDPESSKANIVYTRSLKSNKWYGPLKNSIANLESNGIIVDLTYDKDKKLLGISMEEVNGVTMYNIYKKDTLDICSKWIKMPTSSDPHSGRMKSIVYDEDGKLLGVNADDGQLYKKESDLFDSEWIGPINVDMPMKKVIFDHIDGVMLGISKDDNKIYRKNGKDWTKESWDKEYSSNIEVMDMFHDLDGCLIATTENGIMKQTDANFLSEFIPISETKITKPLFDNNRRMRFRTGLDLSDRNMDDENELTKKLDTVLTFKKEAKTVCKNKKFTYTQEQNDSIGVKDIKKQNQEMEDIRDLMNLLKDKYEI